jgi:Flp pilus assembly protein TadG
MRRRTGTARRGIAAVEFAVVSPLLVMLLLGTWEVGRLTDARQIVENAAGEGGSQASTGVYTNDKVQEKVRNYLQAAGWPIQNLVVTVDNLTSPGTDASNATQLDRLKVTVSIPFQDVRWSAATLVTNNATKVVAESVWYSARVEAYPTNIAPPTGS